MSKRLNILYVPFWYPPHEDQPVSTGAFIREHVISASVHDDIHVLLLRTEEKRNSKTLVKRYTSNGIDVIDITPPFTGSQFRNTLFRRALWLRGLAMSIRKWGKPDLIHCQDMSSFYAGPSAKILGIPFVVSQHWSGFNARLVFKATREKCKVSFNRAKIILTTSRTGKKDLYHYGIKGDIRWIPNSFNSEVFNSDNITQERGGLLHASNFAQDSRVKSVIQAFKQILPEKPDTVLHLVGDGARRTKIEQFASEMLPQGSFVFHGNLPGKERAALMRTSLGFIYPVLWSLHSCYLMEAIACGCPSLASAEACKPIDLEETDVLLSGPDDIDSISRGMIKFIDGDHNINVVKAAQSLHTRFTRQKIGALIHKCHCDALV
ncbi:MAG: glycosyltransferase [Candidatus Sabulitectum sp.]|nr:glycosyltransferase [Candidatus Sabulitectum sp.]